MRKTAGSPARIGIDFGTTNSSVAWATEAGAVRLTRFAFRGAETQSYRSVLYFEQHAAGIGPKKTHAHTGPRAIEEYLAADEKGRLVQSLKSHLPDTSLTGTEVFGRRHKLEELIAKILSDLRKEAEEQFGFAIHAATVGRPVRFVGAETAEDDAVAESRLRASLELAGFEDVRFVLEPVAAAHSYEATLDHDALILIGDFGGGTSDFSLLRVGPEARRRNQREDDLLGTTGVGLAGDAFDARLVRRLVSPALGADAEMISFGKRLPAVPAWIFANLERWHTLSFLRTANVREILRGARARALEPEKIEALATLIEEDLGFQLHQAVERTKLELSRSEQTTFRFRDGSLALDIPVQRNEFETWIAEDLRSIEAAIDELHEKTGVEPERIDRVFLTGGTSFVPAVRSIFARRYGQHKLSGGNEFTSVAQGLALIDAARA